LLVLIGIAAVLLGDDLLLVPVGLGVIGRFRLNISECELLLYKRGVYLWFFCDNKKMGVADFFIHKSGPALDGTKP